MTDGRRWLALDADLFGKRFTDDLYRKFGWAGVVTWVAFLCACKRSRHPGRITALSEAEAAHILGIADWDLADNDGKPWTLDDFWAFTGRKKQTRRTRHGRRFDVISTHWDRWQFAAGKAREAEQKRTSRAEKRLGRTGRVVDRARTNIGPDVDPDSDTPLAPQGGGWDDFVFERPSQTQRPDQPRPGRRRTQGSDARGRPVSNEQSMTRITYVPPSVGLPLELWVTHPLFQRMAVKARNIVATHAKNIAHNEGRLAGTVRFKTGKTDWTKEEARAFLRSRCGWTTPAIQLALLEAYEYGRCVPDCRFCHGASFKVLTEEGKNLGKMSIDVFNPRSALPKFGHLTGFRCHDYNRAKAGRCLDEWADVLDLLDQESDKQQTKQESCLSAAGKAFKAGGRKPQPYDCPMFGP